MSSLEGWQDYITFESANRTGDLRDLLASHFLARVNDDHVGVGPILVCTAHSLEGGEAATESEKWIPTHSQEEKWDVVQQERARWEAAGLVELCRKRKDTLKQKRLGGCVKSPSGVGSRR